MNTPNISSVVSGDKTESRINQLKLMFLLLDRINFKSNWQSDDNSVFFIARARDVIIEEGHGFGNKVSVTLHNFESNLKLNITYVGQYTVPDACDEPEHFQLELVSTFGKSIKLKATSCEEVYELVQGNLNSILPTFVGVLTEDVVGMIKGKEYSFEKVIAHGQPVGYVKTKDESGNEVLVDSESFDMVVD